MIRILLAIGALQALVIVFNVVRTKVLSVALGPSGLGIIGTIDQFVQTVLQISVLSLPSVSIKFMSRAHSVDQALFQRACAAFLKSILALSMGGALLGMTVVSWRPGILGGDLSGHHVDLNIALALVPLLASALLISNMLAASQQPIPAAAFQAAMGALMATAAGIGIAVGGIREVYIMSLAGALLLVTAAYGLLARLMGLRPLTDPGNVREQLRREPGVVPSTLMAYVTVSAYSVSLLAPRYIVLSVEGAQNAGILQALLSLSLAVGAVLAAMNGQYLAPLLNRRSAIAEKLEAATSFQYRQLLLLAVLATPIVVFPDVVLRMLFSEQFTAAAPLLGVFVAWQIFVLQGTIVQQVLFSVDELVPMAVVTVIGYGVGIALCLALIRTHSLAGVGAAMLAGSVVVVALGTGYLYRRFGFLPGRRLVLLAAYSAVAVMGAPWLLARLGVPPGISVERTAVAVALGMTIAAFTNPEDRRAALALVRTYAAPRPRRPK